MKSGFFYFLYLSESFFEIGGPHPDETDRFDKLLVRCRRETKGKNPHGLHCFIHPFNYLILPFAPALILSTYIYPRLFHFISTFLPSTMMIPFCRLTMRWPCRLYVDTSSDMFLCVISIVAGIVYVPSATLSGVMSG